MIPNKQSNRKAISPISGGEIPVPGPGRPKGVPNRFTNLRDAFLEAFKETGGAQGLIDWVNKNSRNKGDFYKMITKMLPANIEVDHKGDITVILSNDYAPKNGK